MPTWDQYGNLLSLQDEVLAPGSLNKVAATSPLGNKGFVAPPSTAGVTRFGPAHLDPAILKPGDFAMQNGGWVGTGQNPLFAKGLQAWDAKTGNYGGTGGGVPAPGTPGGLPVQQPGVAGLGQIPAPGAPAPSPGQTQAPGARDRRVGGWLGQIPGAAQPGQNTGAFQPPAGFDVRQGSNDPAVNHQVYGSNYFPGNLRGFEGISTKEQFFALTPDQQGAYREALASQFQRAGSTPAASGFTETPDPRAARAAAEAARTGQGAQNSLERAGTLQTIVNKGLDMVGGGTGGAVGGTQTPAGSGGTTGGGLGSVKPFESGTTFDRNPRTGASDLPGLRTAYTVDDVMMDPGFKWKQGQIDQKLEDMFAAKGRIGSTDYFNTKANQQSQLISNEYDRINTQQYDRNVEINRLLYDRRYQESVLNYEREYRENERKYGREKADEILAYERSFREDARDYERVRYLVDLGFGATQSGAAA